MLETDAAAAAELNCNIHLALITSVSVTSLYSTSPLQIRAFMPELRDYTACLTQMDCSLSVPIIRHAKLAKWTQLFDNSTKKLRYTQHSLWLSEVSGHACCCFAVRTSQQSLLDKTAICSFMRLQHLLTTLCILLPTCMTWRTNEYRNFNIQILYKMKQTRNCTPAMTKAIICGNLGQCQCD